MWKVFLLLGCAAGFGFVFCDDQCGANERYVACPDTMCIPQNCSQRGLPVPCPILGPEGNCPGKPRCICVENYLRDDTTGVCIPSKKCKTQSDTATVEAVATATADAEVIQTQSDTATVEAVATATADASSSCGCGGYPPRCGKNEVYNNCSDPGCRPYLCSELGFPLKCDRKCKPGCICKDGYVRDDNGVCILINNCPSCGGDKNAQSGCGGNCGRTCATYKIKPVICPLGCILNGCNCRDGFVYDPNVKACVRPQDCTPTCKVNEQYSSCINSGCSPRNCSQVGKPVPCVDPVKCIKGCVCVKGYLRAANGTCVPQDQCNPTCSGKNEYYDNCIKGCSKQLCSDIGQSFSCPAQPEGQCKCGCRCKPGFWRNKNNVCVSQDDCPKPNCPSGEVWDWCPTVKCDGDYCAKTKYSPQTCPVGIVCDKPRCVCGLNRKRDWKTGKCIPIPDCPPFKCDCNEKYVACPKPCQEENCSMFLNKTKCVPFNIGITANCRPRCQCRKGYYRNSAGACVAPYECSLDSPHA